MIRPHGYVAWVAGGTDRVLLLHAQALEPPFIENLEALNWSIPRVDPHVVVSCSNLADLRRLETIEKASKTVSVDEPA